MAYSPMNYPIKHYDVSRLDNGEIVATLDYYPNRNFLVTTHDRQEIRHDHWTGRPGCYIYDLLIDVVWHVLDGWYTDNYIMTDAATGEIVADGRYC